jgi:branched-chain amino acid aminotransferase
MGIESKVIWFDGEFVPFDQANVHVLSHTLHYGLGAFEGIRAYVQPDGRPGIWRLEEHLERFLDSLKMMRIECPYTMDDLVEACKQTLVRNDFKAAYLRPLAFMGKGSMGLGARGNPLHVIIAAWEWGAYLGEDGLKNGVRLRTSTFVRNHPNSLMQRAKVVGHYVNSIMARWEANDDGFDEALMLDQNGFVAEGTGENVFVARNGKVMTPPAINILPGITRATMLELLKMEGIDATTRLFARDAFYVADEAWMVGTAAEVTPIRSVDRVLVDNDGQTAPGPITKRMQDLYAASVRGEYEPMRRYITVV